MNHMFDELTPEKPVHPKPCGLPLFRDLVNGALKRRHIMIDGLCVLILSSKVQSQLLLDSFIL